MRALTERELKAVCLESELCSATEIEQAVAAKYRMSQRGETADLLDLLVTQGSLTSEQARGIRDATAAEGLSIDAEARPASSSDPTLDCTPEELRNAAQAGAGAEKAPVTTDASPGAKPFGSDLVGRVLGGCRLERELGRGAMGVVFEATHLSLQRRVAVKVLVPRSRGDDLDVKQFFQEARAMASVEHQNIVQVHDVGEQDGLNFIVMQLLEGGTLADRIEKDGAVAWEQACRIARDAALGLAVAHEKNVVHRDIKPENLMITTEGVVKIADFGLAAKSARAGDESVRTEVMGTPAYMSPEQIDGRNVDGRADVYSLGCTLYVMLAGRKPFDGDSAIEVLLKQTKDVATPVQKLVPAVPPSVSQLVEKCMAKSARARYQSASDLACDLDKILSGGRPKIVVEIEDVMARMQEIARDEIDAKKGVAQRPAVVVSGAVALVCATAIVMMIALPSTSSSAEAANIAFPPSRESAAVAEARQALAEAVAFAGRFPDRPDLAQQRFDEIAREHGAALGAELVAARDKVQSEFDARCSAAFAKVRAASDDAMKRGDPVAAAQALFGFPSELRKGKPGESWNADSAKILAQIRTTQGMAFVPAGRLSEERVGGAASDLGAFLIDLTEVSNADYAAFVQAKSARAPAHWKGAAPPTAMRDLPVVGVTPAEAAAYAAWKGKRLPTAAEWERAAGGDAGLAYPWGADFDAARCATRAAGAHELVPVRTFPGGRSPFGVLNMAGNAAEWVADSSNDPIVGVGHEVRGGSAKSHPTACSTYARYFLPEDTSDPALLVGFRCAKDVAGTR